MRTELTSHYNLFGDMQIRWYNADDADNLLDKKDAEIRRLHRSMNLMKARYFFMMMHYAEDLSRLANERIIHKHNLIENPTFKCKEDYEHEADIFDNARIKCLKNADKFKEEWYE